MLGSSNRSRNSSGNINSAGTTTSIISDMDQAGQTQIGQTMSHSRCVQVNLNDMTKAVSIFSQKFQDGSIPLVIIPEHRPRWSYTMYIPSGCNCLLQNCGKDAGLANPGLQLFPPWWRIGYIVSRQSSTYNAPVQQCPTKDDVMVSADVTVVFNISDPKKFVYNLGAAKFDIFLTGAVEEGIRVLIRQQLHNEVYQLRGNRAGNLLSLLNNKFNECGVTFTDCKITSVWLPQELSLSLERAKTMDIKRKGEMKRHEFESIKINQEFERQIEKIKRENEQLMVSEQGKKKIAEMEREQGITLSEKRKQDSVLAAESQASVQMADSRNQLENAKVIYEKDKLVLVADAMRDAHSIKAAANFYHSDETTKAEGDLLSMKTQAETMELESTVEKKSMEMMSAVRKHELDLRESKIWGKYAANGKIKLIGRQGDMILTSLIEQGKLLGESQSI